MIRITCAQLKWRHARPCASAWIKIVRLFESLASGFKKHTRSHSVCICAYIYIRAHKVTYEERRVAYAHLGAKPSLVEARRELFVMPCLNYSGSPGDIRGWLCSFVPAHAAVNIDYTGYSFASIGPLICRKFVIRRRRASRANCLQYSSNSASRRICVAVTRTDASRHVLFRWTTKLIGNDSLLIIPWRIHGKI